MQPLEYLSLRRKNRSASNQYHRERKAIKAIANIEALSLVSIPPAQPSSAAKRWSAEYGSLIHFETNETDDLSGAKFKINVALRNCTTSKKGCVADDIAACRGIYTFHTRLPPCHQWLEIEIHLAGDVIDSRDPVGNHPSVISY
jgi:hypothetical protein